MNYLITIDIGGTNIRAALFHKENSEILKIKKISTHNPGNPDEKPVDRLISCIQSIWPEDGKVLGICAAAPGSIDVNQGMVLLAPNIPGWLEFPLGKILKDHFDTTVLVENDANMAAYGEFKLGSGIGHKNLLYFTISTGIGGGVIINGKLLQGEIGIAAELGHITVHDKGALCGCGKLGHWESYSSGTGIENFVKNGINKNLNGGSAFSSSAPSAFEIAEAAREGNELAKAAFGQAGYFMGIGIANYLHIFNPSCVIIGGGVAQSGNLVFDPFHKSLKEHVLNKRYLQNLKITTTELGDNVGLMGCAEFLHDYLNESL